MNTLGRLVLIIAPLLAVAVHSAPQWPARAQMWEGQGQEALLGAAQAWKDGVCMGSGGYWCGETVTGGRGEGVSSEFYNSQPELLVQEVQIDSDITQQISKSGGGELANDAGRKLGEHDLFFPLPYGDETITAGLVEVNVHENQDTVNGVEVKLDQEGAVALHQGGIVLMLGDSLMNDVVSGLRTSVGPEFRIINRAKASTGLSNREYYNWPMIAADAVKETNPTWVVIHLGGNDGQNIVHDGKRVDFGTQQWNERYQARAEEMISNIRSAAPQASIIWLGLPPMRPGKYADKSKKISQLQEAASQAQGIVFVAGSEAMGSAYQKTGPGPDGRVAVLRNDDGIHYTRAGGSILGVAIGARAGWKMKN